MLDDKMQDSAVKRWQYPQDAVSGLVKKYEIVDGILERLDSVSLVDGNYFKKTRQKGINVWTDQW